MVKQIQRNPCCLQSLMKKYICIYRERKPKNGIILKRFFFLSNLFNFWRKKNTINLNLYDKLYCSNNFLKMKIQPNMSEQEKKL